MANEAELYPLVALYLKEQVGCLQTKENTGTKFGHIDVVGVKERKSNLSSQPEIVAVEVKRGAARFLNSVGQALSYSLYAHRVYLAWEKPEYQEFSDEEIDIAAKFGVGLLHINSKGKLRLVSSSASFIPEQYHLLQIIEKLGYFQCTICNSVYPSDGATHINQPSAINLAVNPNYKGKFVEIIKTGKPAFYYLYELAKHRADERGYVHDKRFICNDCAGIFASFID